MRQITALALFMASEGDWSETSAQILQTWRRPADGEDFPEYRSRNDTLEPVAAAVELLPGISSSRKICVVVDVGAGTTDIGVFQSLTPDSASLLTSKLIPAGPTMSVFKAGDVIDRALLDLINELYPEHFKRQKNDLEGRIRSIKETLFKYGRLQEGPILVDLSQLEKKSEINLMATEIRECLLRCLRQARPLLEQWLLQASFVDRKIEVVMAGGGAEINFLRRAISKIVEINERRYEVNLTIPVPPQGLQMHGAGYMRLAVALGGVNPLYDSVIQKHEKLVRVPGLGVPKQSF
jgi:molecular chaperone HscA